MIRKLCTEQQVKDYCLVDWDDSFDASVDGWIESISGIIENMCNRKLGADVVGSGDDEFEDKYFDGNNRAEISIDDCLEVDSVFLGDMYGDNLVEITSDVISYPKIAPIRKIIRKSGTFSAGLQNLKIGAKWGLFVDIPADLAFAATVLVAGIITNQTKGTQAKKSESIGNFSVTYVDDKGIADYDRALSIINAYKKIIL